MVLQESWRGRRARYRLLGGRCGSCGRVHYPPRERCPYCGGGVEEGEMPRAGKLISYTILYSVEDSDRGESPVIVGLVDLGVARVVSEIVDAEPGLLKSGMKVEAVFRRLYVDGPTGVIVYGVKFRPSG